MPNAGPAQSSWKSPTLFVYDPNKSTPPRPRVLHRFSLTISMGKKGKTEVGNAGDRGVKKNSTLWQNMAIFVWDSFQLLSQLAPDT